MNSSCLVQTWPQRMNCISCLYLIYPRYNPYISMTYDTLHMVFERDGCLLQTFGCLEWESQLYRGIMHARCYPFNMWGHSFHNMKPQEDSHNLSQGYTRDILIIKYSYQGYAWHMLFLHWQDVVLTVFPHLWRLSEDHRRHPAASMPPRHPLTESYPPPSPPLCRCRRSHLWESG